jgi:hypothetical protein
MESCDTDSELVICITAPNISCGFIHGRVIYQSSCQRFLIPSTAAASYSDLSIFCKPAIKVRKLIPRLNQSCTTIRIGII